MPRVGPQRHRRGKKIPEERKSHFNCGGSLKSQFTATHTKLILGYKDGLFKNQSFVHLLFSTRHFITLLFSTTAATNNFSPLSSTAIAG
jgi:hypothetical protein